MWTFLIGALAGGDGKTMSIGRILLIITFLVELLHWLSPFILNRIVVVPASLDTVFQSLILYEVFKHGKHSAELVLTSKSRTPPSSTGGG